MANSYTPTDVYQIVNACAKQMYGAETTIQVSDTTSFATVAEAMLRTGYENTLNALSTVLGRTYIAIRPYRHNWDLITVDEDLFGLISRKISYFTKGFEASQNFNTQLNPGQLEDGQSVDHYKINKTYPLEMNYVGLKVLQKSYTRFEEQLDVAFRSPEDLGAFITGMLTEIENEVELGIEAENALLVQNHIAGIYSKGLDTQKVNLTAGFNTKFGTSYTSEELRTTHFTEFLEYMTSQIKIYSDLMSRNSTLYHLTPDKVDDAGNNMVLLRHTPKDLQRLFLYKPLIYDAESRVFPQIFHDDYLKIDNYEGVLYWQNPNEPEKVVCKPNVLNTTTGKSEDSATAVTVSYVVGLLFDRDALYTSYKLNKTRSTPVNAGGDYYNVFQHWGKSYNDDFTENSVLFFMED